MSTPRVRRMLESLERVLLRGSEKDRLRALSRWARWIGVGRDPFPLSKLLPILKRDVLEASRTLPHATGAILGMEGASLERVARWSAIGYRCEDAVQILGRALAHPLPLLRRIARQALLANVSSRPIRDDLEKLLSDRRRDVRNSAARILRENFADLRQGLDAVRTWTSDSAPELRGLAVGRLGRHVEENARFILDGLKDRSTLVRFKAGISLSSLLSVVDAAVPTLTAMLGKPGWDRRAALRSFLILIGHRKDVVVPLMRCVGSPDRLVSEEARDALMGAFRALDGHRARLLRLLRHSSAHVRANATTLLRLLVDDPEKTVSLLGRALRDPEAIVRRAAVRAVGVLRPESSDFVAALRSSLRRAPVDLALHVARALKALNMPPPDLAALYSRAVGSSSVDVRLDSLDALADLGPAARPALPVVRKSAHDRDLNVRLRAVGVLECMGSAGLAELRRLLRDPEEDTRRFARNALHRALRR